MRVALRQKWSTLWRRWLKMNGTWTKISFSKLSIIFIFIIILTLSYHNHGNEMDGRRIHRYSGQRLNINSTPRARPTEGCRKWAVVNVNESIPGEAVRRLMYRREWCVVIVGNEDLKIEKFIIETSVKAFFYLLTNDDLKKFPIFKMEETPKDSLSRKNFAYLFAMSKGANVIFDLSDQSLLKFWIKNASPDSFHDIDYLVDSKDELEVLQPILNETIEESLRAKGINNEDLLVLHSPQQDIYLQSYGSKPTGKSESSFSGTDLERKLSKKSVAIASKKALGSNNSKVSLFFYDSFWALMLPLTVEKEVKEMYRSYITKTLFDQCGFGIGLLPRSLVVNKSARLNIPIKNENGTKLVKILEGWKPDKSLNMIELIENLWIFLFEAGVIEEMDVQAVQEWINGLINIGYEFPNCKGHKSLALEVNHEDMSRQMEVIKSLGSLILQSRVSKSTCKVENDKVLTFASSDVHDGPRTDVPSVILHLNQSFVHLGPRDASKNHPKVFENPKSRVLDRRISPVLKIYTDPSDKMKKDWPKINYEFYKNDEVIRSVDAFICTFPAAMCQIWRLFKKPIIFLPAHRYNLGRCTLDEWRDLDKFVKDLNSTSNQKGNIVASVSTYDAEYLKFYTGVTPLLLESFSGYYTDSDLWINSEKKPEILIFRKSISEEVKEHLKPEIKAEWVHNLYPFYTMEKIARHRAVVILPYSVMSYRTSELYSLCIPIFAPSPKFYMNYTDKGTKEPGLGSDRAATSKYYCSEDPDLRVKMERSLEPGIHPYSPNLEWSESPEDEMYWLQMADFYHWPHIHLFDNYNHLKVLLSGANMTQIHVDMKTEMQIREKKLTKNWCKVFKTIHKSKKRI